MGIKEDKVAGSIPVLDYSFAQRGAADVGRCGRLLPAIFFGYLFGHFLSCLTTRGPVSAWM